MSFVHLHLHSEYSLLDGACRIKELVSAVKNSGEPAVAVTDHGNMYGAIEFYKTAKAAGIKPILGCEVYVAARSRFDKVHELDAKHSHLTLLCENNKGYQNLCKLVSRAYTEGFYGRPRVDHELLLEYHEGIIALSACLQGEIPRAILRGDTSGAKDLALWYRDTFGKDNFFLEVQNHGLPEQNQVTAALLNLSAETGIPLVATNDTHYLTKADSKMQKCLILIGTGKTTEDDNVLDFGSDEFYLKTESEMLSLFPSCPEAVSVTADIASRCHVEFEFGVTKLPHFDLPDGTDHFEYFKERCLEGLYKKVGKNPSEAYTERLSYELETVRSMGYVDYYLIVGDFIGYAKGKGIPVGPGRGSGAGSLAAYCMDITDIDPIRYNLLFERFLNPERVTMPDFDVDFCYVRRQEVIDYVTEKYGNDHVAQIVTFGTMAARAAIRDVGRALAMPYSSVDTVAKLVPHALNMTIDTAMIASKELKTLYESDQKVKELIDMAKRVEGMPRHASTHAAGVVITRDPVSDYVPLAKSDDAVVTQYTMTALEEIGLLKFDFLGLRNLTIIDNCVKMIQKTDAAFRLDAIPTDDPAVFKMMSAGKTEGIFQFESGGMKRVLQELKPTSIEDLIAVLSLYRPGPMQSIPKYIENRHNPEHITYPTPLLKPILDVTYGCLVYQEQVMQVLRSLAGYSFGQADIVRRAMSKKKHDVMKKERKTFVSGCVEKGIDSGEADRLFDQISAFSSYAFNKSHAAAYAFVAYQTAYLKSHYAKEYMASLLTSVLDRSDKVGGYIEECSRLHIKLLPPHVNHSSYDFTAEKADIRFGLLAIKNLGRGLIDLLMTERENGPYLSFEDFCRRLFGRELNRRALESLIKSGALDGLGLSRKAMLRAADLVLEHLNDEKRRNVDGQMGFFEMSAEPSANELQVSDLPEFEADELAAQEKEVTGLYLSGHPMMKYSNLYDRLRPDKISDLYTADQPDSRYTDGGRVTVLGLITYVKQKTTKKNDTMAFITLEDQSDGIEVLVFPKIYSGYFHLFKENTAVILSGRISVKDESEIQLICESVSLPELPQKLYIKVPSTETSEFKDASRIVTRYPGTFPLFVYFEDNKKTLRSKTLLHNGSAAMIEALRNRLGFDNVKYN